MIDDIVFQDIQYIEIKTSDIGVTSPNIIIYGNYDSTELTESGQGESITIF
jgi:hypothetical protein